MWHWWISKIFNRRLKRYFRYYHKVGNKDIHVIDPLKIRNVGVIAHIDAGKTTTTERMLYLAGVTKVLGDVDSGNTITDYMDQERERGISITSAVATFHWNEHKINLIDTPGHVDFTSEVQCSLSAIDSAIVILDASAGVEAQTIQVWRQADAYSIPKLVFLNMDKSNASVTRCLRSLRNKFNCLPLLLQSPLYTTATGGYRGVVDLIASRKYDWGLESGARRDGKKFAVGAVGNEEKKFIDERLKFLDELAELDDVFANRYITDPESVTVEDVKSVVVRLTKSCRVVPVLMGSSFRSIGVQPLIDGLISLLPAPVESKELIDLSDSSANDSSLRMLVFKTIHRKKKPLFLCRVLGGELRAGVAVFNEEGEGSEVVGELSCVNGEELEGIKSAKVGDIVAISGPRRIKTGDFLTDSSRRRVPTTIQRQRIVIPEPVFFCSIETGTLGEQKYLDEALECLQREDPSLKVRVDAATGQTILGGMGQLHLEVIRERIRREYNLDVDLGPLQIAYMESVEDSSCVTHTVEKIIGGVKNVAIIEATVGPATSHNNSLVVRPKLDSELMKTGLKPQFKKALQEGLNAAMSRGTVFGQPMINVGMELNEFIVARGTSLPIVSLCASQCLSKAVAMCSPYLLQPVMIVEVEAPVIYSSTIFSELSNRGSEPPTSQPHSTDCVSIKAVAPLARLQDFATCLRTKTSGLATFTMRLHKYEKVHGFELSKILSKAV